ncbi:MAG: hypothetical protein ACFFD4_25645 [Candidatus Odinarchaeota archaeon]
MAEDILLFGLSLDFWYNALFAFIDIFFGIMLWFVDNRGKKRQEVSMKRQDESLDIILEQISKVNTFQTRVLSLAIDTLEKDMEEMKQTIDSRFIPATEPETSISQESTEISEPVPSSQAVTKPSPSLGEYITSGFQTVLREQLTGMVEGIKKSLSDLPGIDAEESYKAKKSLEFDLKNLVRGLEGLENAGRKREKEERKKALLEEQREKMREKLNKTDSWEPEIKEKARAIIDEEDEVEVLEDGYTASSAEEVGKEILSEIEDIKSLKDLGSFASSILESVSKNLNLEISKGMEKDIAGLKKDLAEKKRQKEIKKQKQREFRKLPREKRRREKNDEEKGE